MSAGEHLRPPCRTVPAAAVGFGDGGAGRGAPAGVLEPRVANKATAVMSPPMRTTTRPATGARWERVIEAAFTSARIVPAYRLGVEK